MRKNRVASPLLQVSRDVNHFESPCKSLNKKHEDILSSKGKKIVPLVKVEDTCMAPSQDKRYVQVAHLTHSQGWG
ncbi:hypothetical protein E2C01_047043 [Portunus trituberculatus]|uniref:Uncharacterized protein n=1 Tax=Portunus trituberculatus TaxID=210409 RepID=A0A5B7G6H0_PORTR|nr:hypothetical protein [Portunus trituberculatus]